jgi:competence protein ComEA
VVALAVVAWLLLRTPDGPPTEALLPMAGGASDASTSSSAVSSPGSSSGAAATAASGVVLVHAAGAVMEPGVYSLPAGSRVADLVDAAGGPAPDADLDQLNLAAPLVDGERVYVPRAGETVVAASSGTVADDAAGPLDLNAATLEELDELPGIGPATARAIIDERERRGGFRSVDELLDVRGIGPAKLEDLRPLVRV